MIKNWHFQPLPDIFSLLNSFSAGLSQQEADSRLARFGKNVLPQEKPYSKLRLFLRQFNSPLMYILLGAVAISSLLKHYSDTILIVLVLLINTIVGFYQENKANQSLLALKKLVKIKARVLRDGRTKEIDSEELVPGDIVFLKSGDKVPADGRLIEAKNLKLNEASLTGESQAVAKQSGDGLPLSVPLPERKNMVFMGTIVEEGQATLMVVVTGVNTQIGEVVALLKEAKEKKTPLQKKIASLSKITGVFILSIILAIVIIGYLTGRSFSDIFIVSLALAVSAIPEGLLPAITVILVLGMRRISRQHGLVRKLAATETLGSVTVICTDKTGTLTEGKPRITDTVVNGEVVPLDHGTDHSALDLLTLAAAVESKSEHPLARAIVRDAKARGVRAVELADFKNIVGQGVSGKFGGAQALLGRRELLEAGPLARWAEKLPPAPAEKKKGDFF